jgi:hypothetical protein
VGLEEEVVGVLVGEAVVGVVVLMMVMLLVVLVGRHEVVLLQLLEVVILCMRTRGRCLPLLKACCYDLFVLRT